MAAERTHLLDTWHTPKNKGTDPREPSGNAHEDSITTSHKLQCSAPYNAQSRAQHSVALSGAPDPLAQAHTPSSPALTVSARAPPARSVLSELSYHSL